MSRDFASYFEEGDLIEKDEDGDVSNCICNQCNECEGKLNIWKTKNYNIQHANIIIELSEKEFIRYVKYYKHHNMVVFEDSKGAYISYDGGAIIICCLKETPKKPNISA